MLYTASKPLGVWFPSSGGDPELGSPLDRTFLIILLCVALMLLVRRKFDWTKAIRANPWLILLVGFMLVSVFWSGMPFVSFKRWTRELVAVLMAFIVLSEPTPRRAVESILRRTIYVLIPFSVLLIKYFPWYGVEYGRWSGARMWIGVTQQKNGLGSLCVISVFFLIWSLVGRWKIKSGSVWKYEPHVELLLLVISIWLLRGPTGDFFYSATSSYSLCIGLLVYCGMMVAKRYGRFFSAATFMIIAASIIVLGILILFKGGSSIEFAASGAGRDASLTGRTTVWAALVPVAMKRPLLGNGFGGFWTIRSRADYKISGAHSGYLDVLLGLGFAGILLTSIFILSSCKKAHLMLCRDFDWGALWICYIMIALVHNMTESSIDSLSAHLTAVIIFFTVTSTSLILPKYLFSGIEPSKS